MIKLLILLIFVGTINGFLPSGTKVWKTKADGSIADKMKVATRMLNAEIDTVKVLEAQQFLQGSNFDIFVEKIDCKVLKGIPHEMYPKVVDVLSDSNDLDSGIRQAMKLAQWAEDASSLAQEFLYVKGANSRVLYGRLVSGNDFENQKIDLALALYKLDFRFSPKVDMHKVEQKSGWWLGKKTQVWYEKTTSIIELDEKKQEFIVQYFRKKAIDRFAVEFKALVESETLLDSILKHVAVKEKSIIETRDTYGWVRRGIKWLMTKLFKDEESKKEITPKIEKVTKTIQKVQFSKFIEDSYSNLLQGIPNAFFERVLTTICSGNGIPSNVQETILNKITNGDADQTVNDFYFKNNQTGRVTLIRMAIDRNQTTEKIDMAVSSHSVEYKIQANAQGKPEAKKFEEGMPSKGTEVFEKDQFDNDFALYLAVKAIEDFMQRFPDRQNF